MTPRQSRGTASIRSSAVLALSRICSDTVTTGVMVWSEKRISSREVGFMLGADQAWRRQKELLAGVLLAQPIEDSGIGADDEFLR